MKLQRLTFKNVNFAVLLVWTDPNVAVSTAPPRLNHENVSKRWGDLDDWL